MKFTIHQNAAFSQEIEAESEQEALERMEKIVSKFVDKGDFYLKDKEVGDPNCQN